MCLIVLFFWVSFQYARVLVWEIWDPKFSESTSQLLDSLCYCLHYCRKIFSVLRKRLFSFLKLIISLRCQACFFFHATAAQEKAICQACSSSRPPSIHVGEEVGERAVRKKRKKRNRKRYSLSAMTLIFLIRGLTSTVTSPAGSLAVQGRCCRHVAFFGKNIS